MTPTRCTATTTGPRRLPCTRTTPHTPHDGCVFDAGDRDDHHTDTEARDD